MSQMDFRGRTVLITGAGRGLGLAYARAVGKLGATVLLHDVGADTDGTGTEPAIAENAAARLSIEGITAHPFHTPINTRDDCQDVRRRWLKCQKPLEITCVVHGGPCNRQKFWAERLG